MPKPEMLGPVGAYLASERLMWCNGQVIFSSGSEVAWLAPPRLLEVVDTSELTSLPAALETLVPQAFVAAEVAQATNGGSNPRFAAVFADPPASAQAQGPAEGKRCLLVTDSDEWRAVAQAALLATGIACVALDTRTCPPGFDAARAAVAGSAREHGPLDVVVVANLAEAEPPSGETQWRQLLTGHRDLAERIRLDAGWVRAVADYAAQAGTARESSVRLVTITAATTGGGWSRGQAAAQLARAGRLATTTQVEALAVSLESTQASALQAAADLVAYLAGAADVDALSGAELVASGDRLGLRSHPTPAGSISFAGPELPDWLDGTLRAIVTGG
jgi:hypothetical protein